MVHSLFPPGIETATGHRTNARASARRICGDDGRGDGCAEVWV
ncbi:hypothetical protein AZ78_3413 [Lysobacter capsici AZ78]|uniref:Uncharacterized protein n=1 Tax=Lysobacter capsici AZ78 TaxID=1444315 RepID=A0A108UB25_9GAMM|nr:hypothetical protein AZ78_3413 [Lysobacter capsici AZ78]